MFGPWINFFWSTPQVNIRSRDIKRVWELKAECGKNNCSNMSKYIQSSTNDAKATQIRLRCYKITSLTFTYIHIISLSKRWLSIKNIETNFVFVEMLNNTCTQVVMISILQWIDLNGYKNDLITNPDHSRIRLLMICNSWSLTPLSASLQLCRGCQFYCWRKGEFPEKITDLSQVTDTICCIETTSPWAFFLWQNVGKTEL